MKSQLLLPPTTKMVGYRAMEADENKPKKTLTRKILTSLTFWIIVGTITGILIGEFAPKFGKDAAPMAQIFLRPIQFIVFPLVFSSLVVGIAGNNDLQQLGRLSLKSFIYFEIVTTLALVVGLLAVNFVQPGSAGISKKGNYTGSASSTFTFALWINHLTPKTWGEMMGGSGSSELLQVLVASILTGVATAKTPAPHKQVLLDLATAVMEMMFKFVDIVIWTAPLGVCFAVGSAIGTNGVGALASLGALVATLYGTLVVFIFVVFGPIFFFFKINPLEFLSAMREPLVIAYTTATSEAALPKVFECLLEFGVSRHISAFVVPFGYSFNLDGSTLYLSLAAVFCAQASGVEKSIGEQITMVLMLMISSKGVAGVRSASIIVLASTVDQFNIPSWPVALLLGADWLMDMARTFTNVFGNCLASVVMAKLEGEFRKEGWEKALESADENSYHEHDVEHGKVLEDSAAHRH
ncbi:dicarboxylate/amino acid:cation (Na or H) symporter (DAACS) family protein [Thraustotheca clavata]|uniref:Amino acid transporter n=1 Tax=Thraustotheca clavata TaxID=74557 RepID=A0A1W0A3X1_9STRA|nr:dicarboxylate/amino acid:cation (Na or H) symporter (DAACS) family protein [Thraustotheca clavata]